MISSRRQLLRNTVVTASLMEMSAMFDALLLSVPANASAGRTENGDGGTTFAHPGIFYSADDLRAIRERVRGGAEPWKSAWEKLKGDRLSVLDVAPKPVALVFRGPYAKPDIGSTEILHDSGAACAHALIGALSPDPTESATHYRQAVAILEAWSGTLLSIDGHDQKLLCGLTGSKFAAAAELVYRADNAPRGLWSDPHAQAMRKMLTGIFLPPIRELFPEANGNWDAAMMTTVLSIAILCDDRPLFDHVIDLFHNSGGNGALTSYVYPSGENEETTRDQGHVQMGLGLLAAACRVAFVQGVDLYGAANNRLALGFEYTAKYNLGEDVLCDGGIPGPGARGKFAPIYESVYDHYAVGKGLSMPYTRRVIERTRPEGYDNAFPSWGTLTACHGAELKPPTGDILGTALATSLPREDDREITIASPSGSLAATIGVRGGKLTYALSDKNGRELLRPSTAGVVFNDNIPPLDGGLALWEFTSSRRQIDRPRLFGERGDQNPVTAPQLPFEQRILTLREIAAPHRILRAEIRVYDAGVAFRLTLPPNRDPSTKAKIAAEQTEFVFPNGAVVYESYENEDEFRPVAVRQLKPGAWLPCTARVGDEGPYLSILEVDETTSGTPQTLLSPSKTSPNAVVTAARGPISVPGEESTPFPWRIILTGETPAALAESACVVTSLWPRSLLGDGDRSWIEPGKAIRETTLTTDGGVASIDFAAANGLRYILFDAGWYGPEHDPNSDARKVARPALDLPRVIAHGKEKGIGVFLYVNHVAAEKQLSELAPLYESWGVAGIKLGFVTVGPVIWTQWNRNAVALCAKHHLLVDIHDAYRPVGVSGAYPNLLTQEGIRGNEHMPTPRHNCTLPFTRFLSGPADYTICYRFPRLQTSDVHQMALSVLYYSPLTLVYWYGRPSEYDGLPECEFFRALPTVWDETVWLGGTIGECAAVARRSGRHWYIGAITNESSRTVAIPFDFLPAGSTFTARIYHDTPGSAPKQPIVHGVSRVAITERKGLQRGAATLNATLPSAGGIALWLTAD